LGVGVWVLGVGVWGVGPPPPTPNPQSPIPNPQSPILYYFLKGYNLKFNLNYTKFYSF